MLQFAQTVTPNVAFGRVSKEHLFDMLLDRARAELGETATDYTCMELLAAWSAPVALARKDRAIKPVAALRSAIKQCNQSGYTKGAEVYTAELEKMIEASS